MTKPNFLRRLGFFSVYTTIMSSIISVSAVVFWETAAKAEAHQNNRFGWVRFGMRSKLQIIMDNMTHPNPCRACWNEEHVLQQQPHNREHYRRSFVPAALRLYNSTSVFTTYCQ